LYHLSTLFQKRSVGLRINRESSRKARTESRSSGKNGPAYSVGLIQWTENECPVVAVNAKDMNKDVDGVLTLTNHRIILESVKEIVLKKTLFIATEKKKVREVAFEGPVGSVKSLIKGEGYTR